MKLATLAIALAALHPACAQFTKNDRARLEESIPKTVYLRIDLPCVYGRVGLMVHWTQPMVFVSPTGVSVSQDEGWRGGFVGPKRNMFWGLGPNDPLQFQKLDVSSDGVVTLYFQGMGLKELRKNLPAAVTLIACKTPANFMAAFDRAFSKIPLQEEHPDWSAETRKAIGERTLLAGMSPEQVRCITGTPVDIERQEDEAKTETWHIRQQKGVWAGAIGKRTINSGAVRLVTFVDGKVTRIDAGPEPAKKP